LTEFTDIIIDPAAVRWNKQKRSFARALKCLGPLRGAFTGEASEVLLNKNVFNLIK